MQIYLRIGMASIVLLASSCTTSYNVVPKSHKPYKICAVDEDPITHNCKVEGPAGSITVRGHNE